jgi:hypothetical protein
MGIKREYSLPVPPAELIIARPFSGDIGECARCCQDGGNQEPFRPQGCHCEFSFSFIKFTFIIVLTTGLGRVRTPMLAIEQYSHTTSGP